MMLSRSSSTFQPQLVIRNPFERGRSSAAMKDTNTFWFKRPVSAGFWFLFTRSICRASSTSREPIVCDDRVLESDDASAARFANPGCGIAAQKGRRPARREKIHHLCVCSYSGYAVQSTTPPFTQTAQSLQYPLIKEYPLKSY